MFTEGTLLTARLLFVYWGYVSYSKTAVCLLRVRCLQQDCCLFTEGTLLTARLLYVYWGYVAYSKTAVCLLRVHCLQQDCCLFTEGMLLTARLLYVYWGYTAYSKTAVCLLRVCCLQQDCCMFTEGTLLTARLLMFSSQRVCVAHSIWKDRSTFICRCRHCAQHIPVVWSVRTDVLLTMVTFNISCKSYTLQNKRAKVSEYAKILLLLHFLTCYLWYMWIWASCLTGCRFIPTLGTTQTKS
jgi:hypothetical protein